MTGKADERCPPSLALERALHGELVGSASEPWRAHLEGCPRCAARLEELQQRGAEYMASPRAAALRAQLHAARAKPPRAARSSPVRWLLGVPVAAAATAGLIVLCLHWPLPPDRLQPKGAGILQLAVERAGVARLLTGDLHAGERLQLSWSAPTPGSLAVFVRDAAGRVSTLFPETGTMSVALPAGAAIPLGRSVIFDGTSPRYTLYSFFSKRPHPLATLGAYAQQDRPADLAAFDGQRSRRELLVLPEAHR